MPAAIIGVDVKRILDKAAEEACACGKPGCKSAGSNRGAVLGTIIGELSIHQRDKLTFINSGELKYFGAWIEQLIAESTGKNGKGILPVDGEALLKPDFYTDDRIFVYMHLTGDSTMDKAVSDLKNAGNPVIEIVLRDLYDIGKEFFCWEFATAVAGWRIGIQPFDQPNVESAKIIARKMVKEFSEKGKLPETQPALEEHGIKIYGEFNDNSLKDILLNCLNVKLIGGKRTYIALQAFITPDEKTTDLLQEIRTKIRNKFKLATTAGYGPRFLHSTGQLHKGDSGNGIFIQFIANINEDIRIPDDPESEKSSISFGILLHAQAMGDRQALLDNNRKIITIDLGSDVLGNLKYIISLL